MVKVNDIRKDFPMIVNNPGWIYFDNSATTFKPQSVIDAVVHVYTHTTSNIHRGDYDISVKMSDIYDRTRKHVAKFINAREDEIVFTSGASASLNNAAFGYGLSNLKEGDIILSTEAEHASSILPWFKVAEKTGAKIEYIPLTKEGNLTVENVRKCLSDKVKIVAFAHVGNVLGYVHPVKEIIEAAHEVGACVFLDAAQSAPHLRLDVKDLDCDFMSFSAHKMLGPSGVGVLYGKKNLLDAMDPLMYGGGSNSRFDVCGNLLLQETPLKFESGTPNIEGVAGFDAALTYLDTLTMEEIEKRENELKRYFIEKLSALDNVVIYNANSTSAIVAFNIKDVFAQDAASYLNSKNIAVRTGNHCAKMLVDVIGTSETIRASLYFYNTKEEIDRFVEVCSEITLEKCISLYV